MQFFILEEFFIIVIPDNDGNNNTRLLLLDRVSVGITVDAPVTAVWNKTNDIQYFKDI